jgi:phosphate transport system substrate-binding protein
LFLYVSVKSLERKEVRDFVEFYLKNAPKLSKEVGYIPLPAEIYKNTMKKFQKAVSAIGKPKEKQQSNPTQ